MSNHAAQGPRGEEAPLTSCSCSSMGSMTLQGPHLQYKAGSHCQVLHMIAQRSGLYSTGLPSAVPTLVSKEGLLSGRPLQTELAGSSSREADKLPLML